MTAKATKMITSGLFNRTRLALMMLFSRFVRFRNKSLDPIFQSITTFSSLSLLPLASGVKFLLKWSWLISSTLLDKSHNKQAQYSKLLEEINLMRDNVKSRKNLG